MTEPRTPLSVPWQLEPANKIIRAGDFGIILHVYTSLDVAEHIVAMHNRAVEHGPTDHHHYLRIADDGWTVQHSMSCRSLGINWMHSQCSVNLVVRENMHQGVPPWSP